MPGTYPNDPLPSMVSAPEILDKTLRFSADQGYEVRRAQWSRPRRRWTLSYLGQQTRYMRLIRDFLQEQRLGALDFAWIHPTAIDEAICMPTTPVQLQWLHGLFTGAWVGVSNSPNPSINGGFFQVTKTSTYTVNLNGTTAAGIQGPCNVILYVPHMVGVMSEDTFPSPATLIGPEQIASGGLGGRREGYFNFQVTLEEIF